VESASDVNIKIPIFDESVHKYDHCGIHCSHWICLGGGYSQHLNATMGDTVSTYMPWWQVHKAHGAGNSEAIESSTKINMFVSSGVQFKTT
jgi:hypothetical protein